MRLSSALSYRARIREKWTKLWWYFFVNNTVFTWLEYGKLRFWMGFCHNWPSSFCWIGVFLFAPEIYWGKRWLSVAPGNFTNKKPVEFSSSDLFKQRLLNVSHNGIINHGCRCCPFFKPPNPGNSPIFRSNLVPFVSKNMFRGTKICNQPTSSSNGHKLRAARDSRIRIHESPASWTQIRPPEPG